MVTEYFKNTYKNIYCVFQYLCICISQLSSKETTDSPEETTCAVLPLHVLAHQAIQLS